MVPGLGGRLFRVVGALGIRSFRHESQTSLNVTYLRVLKIVEQSEKDRFAFIALELSSVFLSIVCGQGISLK